MPHAAVFGRIGAVYLSAALNAVALVVLLASSDVVSGKSPRVHQAFAGSIGLFGIGVLFSGAAVIFYHFTRHYYGEGGEGDESCYARCFNHVFPLVYSWNVGICSSDPKRRTLVEAPARSVSWIETRQPIDVCTENSVRIDYLTEPPNVSGDDP